MDLNQSRIQEIRYRVLKALEGDRPGFSAETLIQRQLNNAHCPTSPQDLRRELAYLEGKKLIGLKKEPPTWAAALAAAGLDILEGYLDEPGIVLRDAIAPADLARRQEIRWRILRVVDTGRPVPVLETLTWRTLDDADLLVTVGEVRKEAVYLEQQGLLVINRKKNNEWAFSLSPAGADVCDYTIDAPPGVGRPEKYWQ